MDPAPKENPGLGGGQAHPQSPQRDGSRAVHPRPAPAHQVDAPGVRAEVGRLPRGTVFTATNVEEYDQIKNHHWAVNILLQNTFP